MFLKEKFPIWKDCGMQKASLRVLRWDLGWIEGCSQCPAGHPVRGQDKELLSQHVAGHLEEDNQEQEKVEPHQQVAVHLHMDLCLFIWCLRCFWRSPTWRPWICGGGRGGGEGERSDTNMQSIAAFYLKFHLTYIGRKYWIWYDLNFHIWENLIHNLCVNNKHRIITVYTRLLHEKVKVPKPYRDFVHGPKIKHL